VCKTDPKGDFAVLWQVVGLTTYSGCVLLYMLAD